MEKRFRQAAGKSGADFSRYVYDLKMLGIIKHEYLVENGDMVYYDTAGASLTDNMYPIQRRVISDLSSPEQLKHYINIHQLGQTDYPTFCKHAAEVGVEKWISDLQQMECVYYDKKGNRMHGEAIPSTDY